MTLKVVLDTNLFIAAYFNRRSASAKIIESARKGRIRLVWSEPIKKEMDLILGNVRAKSSFIEKVSEVLEKGTKVSPRKRLRVVKDDPEDNKLLECSQAGKASYLITNDRHLLEVKKFGSAKVIRPKNFISYFVS